MANNTWLGRAAAIKNIVTITLNGVDGDWLTAETITLTINGKDLVLTIGTTSTREQIILDLVDMWNGEDANNDESRSTTGNLLPEFNAVTAAVGSATNIMTLTGDTEGVPFTLTNATDSVSGTISQATSQAATGPNDANNANNWSNAAVPANGDNVFIENSSVSLLYNLGAFSAVTLTSLTIDSTFTGDIGLPGTNAALGYPEYLEQYLTIGATTISIGEGEGTGSGRIKINTGSVQTALTVFGSGSSSESGFGAVIWKGTHASNTVRLTGNADFQSAMLGGEAATIATLTMSDSSTAALGNVTLTTLSMADGCTCSIETAATTITNEGGDLTITGTAAYGTITLVSGTVTYHSSGTITTLTMGGTAASATFTTDGDNRSRTITNATIGSGSTITDPAQTITFTNNIARGSTAVSVTAA